MTDVAMENQTVDKMNKIAMLISLLLAFQLQRCC